MIEWLGGLTRLSCLLKPFDFLRNIGPQQRSSNALGSVRSSSAVPMSFRWPSPLRQCSCANSVSVFLLFAFLVDSSRGLAWWGGLPECVANPPPFPFSDLHFNGALTSLVPEVGLIYRQVIKKQLYFSKDREMDGCSNKILIVKFLQTNYIFKLKVEKWAGAQKIFFKSPRNLVGLEGL